MALIKWDDICENEYEVVIKAELPGTDAEYKDGIVKVVLPKRRNQTQPIKIAAA